MIKNVFVVVVTLLAAGCASAPNSGFQPSAAEVRLAGVIQARLALAPQVAWFKYRNSLPIQVPEREAVVLTAAAGQAASAGVPATAATEVFAAQMAASRVVQAELTRRWSRGGTLPTLPPLSLERDIRPVIDEHNRDLIGALADVRREAASDARAREFQRFTRDQLRAAGFSPAASSAAVRFSTATLR